METLKLNFFFLKWVCFTIVECNPLETCEFVSSKGLDLEVTTNSPEKNKINILSIINTDISDIKLKRTDTTLDLSQEAEKVNLDPKFSLFIVKFFKFSNKFFGK